MAAKAQNFELYQGDTRQIIITVRDDNDAVADLSGFSAHWVMYHPTTKALVFERSTGGGGITIPSPTSGQVLIDLIPTDTETMIPKKYNHELEISIGTGSIYTVTVGTVDILYSKA
jgi:hypothetical protein